MKLYYFIIKNEYLFNKFLNKVKELNIPLYVLYYLIIVMEFINQERNVKHRLKTICTIDTNDIDLTEIRNGPLFSRSKLKGNKSIFPNKFRSKTPKNVNKQEENSKHNRTTSLHKKNMRSNTQDICTIPHKKSQKFNISDINKSYKVTKLLKDNTQEKIYLGQELKTKKKLIIKTTDSLDRIKKYQVQIIMNQEIKNFPTNVKRNFCRISQIERQHRFVTLIYRYYGESFDWNNPCHLQLMRKSLKNDAQILRFIAIQIAQAIDNLSPLGITHGGIKLNNIFIQLQEEEFQLKMQKIVKIGNFEKSFNLRHRKARVLNLDKDIYTPPQILNFMLFDQKNNNFDRQMLNHFDNYEDPSKIDMWALGILLLQIINLSPLQQSMDNIEELFNVSKEIHHQYKSLLDSSGLQQTFKSLIARMVDPDPLNRPHPKQIIFNL